MESYWFFYINLSFSYDFTAFLPINFINNIFAYGQTHWVTFSLRKEQFNCVENGHYLHGWPLVNIMCCKLGYEGSGMHNDPEFVNEELSSNFSCVRYIRPRVKIWKFISLIRKFCITNSVLSPRKRFLTGYNYFVSLK